jgi:y4mF family transcriptional regulator
MARSNKLPEFVKEKRRQSQLTQINLAEKAGVGLRFIRELEQGKHSLRMDKVNQVLRLFGQQLGPIPIEREIFTNEES